MSDMHTQLNDYCTEYWEYVLKHQPTFATFIGDHRYDDALEDLSEESIAAEASFFKDLLAKTEQIDESLITQEDTLNLRLLKNTLQHQLQFFNFRTYYTPLNHLGGAHIDFPQLIEHHPFHTHQDFAHYVARLEAFPRQIDQVIELMQNGIEQKITAFGNIIDHVLEQVESFMQYTPENSPLYVPVSGMANGFSDNERAAIGSTVRDAITAGVIPAYTRLHGYLSAEYRKQCRKEAGVWSLPDGNDLYRVYIKYHTATDLSPEEIHDMGVREVERIEGEIIEIMNRIGFDGSIRGFAGHLKGNKNLYPRTGQEILDTYRNILSHMDEKLPEYFGRLPKAGYAVRKIEEYREKAAPAAYYFPPPRDFSRPGYFYANTYKPEQRPLYDMEALSYHEAVPGHHLQIAIMQELDDIPDFRRHEGSTAFIEGWALYAERLAKEMGFYRDHFSEYGRLSFELWRAVRLVVDTGLHFYKWSREKAVTYCKDNTGLEDHEIEVEVDRYIAIPGQALSYKIGELKILELREKARKILGSKFLPKEFHDRLLEQGALPLNILEDVMDAWMAGQMP